MSGAWKERERLVGKWFGVKRNPLSGSNNRADDGSVREGDILLSYAVVEIERTKRLSLSLGREAREKGKKRGVPWAAIEFKTGAPEMVKLTVDFQTAEYLAGHLKRRWMASTEALPSLKPPST